MAEKMYRYIGALPFLTVEAEGDAQNFLAFVPATAKDKEDFGDDYPGSNLGFRADTPAIAAKIENELASEFEVIEL